MFCMQVLHFENSAFYEKLYAYNIYCITWKFWSIKCVTKQFTIYTGAVYRRLGLQIDEETN
jgi:hypothetical protein